MGAGQPPGGGPAGFITVQFVAATAFSLVLFVWLANLIVFTYARGAVRAALDEGVRAGAAGGAAGCEHAAQLVRSDLLGGALGTGVEISCTAVEGRIEARAQVHLRSWLPPVPDWRFRAAAVFAGAPP